MTEMPEGMREFLGYVNYYVPISEFLTFAGAWAVTMLAVKGIMLFYKILKNTA